MHKVIPLSDATLSSLPKKVLIPRYDRSKLTAGIVHIGVGNFHRAHQAWYLHRLMQEGVCHDWAIIGAGVRPHDAVQRDKLMAQDCLATLIELDPSGKSAEVVGSMIDFIQVEDHNRSLIERLAKPYIRIVSLTITEGGYYIDPACGKFNKTNPDIIYDAANPDKPRTAFGAMIAALRIRRDNDLGPFTGLSCDNIQNNGSILKHTILSLANLSDPNLAKWIENNCSFPNTMVDCIVPATGSKEIELTRSFGIDDLAPITHENFRQWVIEDNFCAGRPDWDKVGATFSNDVHQFEAMKLRILNGGHQIIAVAGALLSIETISKSMEHSGIRSLLRKTVIEEIAPNVKSVPGMIPLDYLDLIDQRFSNPEIIDTTRRVAFDGSSRQPGFIVPSIRDALIQELPIDGLALTSALWMRYCGAIKEDGSAIEANDPNWDMLNATAILALNDPILWLEMRQIYGELSNNTRLVEAFCRWASHLKEHGVQNTLFSFADDFCG